MKARSGSSETSSAASRRVSHAYSRIVDEMDETISDPLTANDGDGIIEQQNDVDTSASQDSDDENNADDVDREHDAEVRPRIVRRSALSFAAAVFVVAMMVWCIYTYVFLYFAVDVEESAARASINLLIYCTLFAMLVFAYVQTMFTSPGYVPENYMSTNAVERKLNGFLRTCKYCMCVKPDRAHHCSSCNACVLKMDHHCVWVNNCVGFHNYKAFLVFLFYVSVTGFYGSISIFVSGAMSASMRSSIGTSVLLLFNLLMQLMFGVVLLGFLLFHVKLVFGNETTLEYLEKRSHRRKQFGSSSINPFDLGWRRNWQSVFGPNVIYWFWPTNAGVPGDGYVYDINQRVIEQVHATGHPRDEPIAGITPSSHV